MWRLAWIQQWLTQPAGSVFDAPMFFPTRGALTFSDPTLLQGVLAAPLIAGGVPLVATYNLTVLLGHVTSGLALHGLARRLGADALAATIGACVFVFAPYRVSHDMHLELLWAGGVPLAIWALLNALERPSWRAGCLLGLAMSLQVYSALYYGAYLPPLLCVMAAVWWVLTRRPAGNYVWPLLSAVATVGLCVVPFARAFHAARAANLQELAVRSADELATYSAHVTSYLAAPSGHWIYGWTYPIFGGPETSLLVGASALGLAALGVKAGWRRPETLALAAGVAFTVDASLGVNGVSFPLMRTVLPGFDAMRAPGRFAQLGLACLAPLAALGFQYLRSSPRAGRTAAAVAAVLVLLESGSGPPTLTRVSAARDELSTWLAGEGAAVVFEWPVASLSSLPGPDPEYLFGWTRHRRTLVNGYSGFYPPSYVHLLARVQSFPRGDALSAIEETGATHVVLHAAGITQGELEDVSRRIDERRLRFVGHFRDGFGMAYAYRVVR